MPEEKGVQAFLAEVRPLSGAEQVGRCRLRLEAPGIYGFKGLSNPTALTRVKEMALADPEPTFGL